MTPDLKLRILLTSSLFFWGVSSKIVGTWALDNFSMSCPIDGHSCNYTFQVIEGVDRSNETTTGCTFTVRTQTVAANVLNFTSQPCDGDDAYRVNASWDPLGFITLCVSRAAEDTWAFFGYGSGDVLNANASWRNVRPAYEMFTFNATDEPARRARRGPQAVGGGGTGTARGKGPAARPGGFGTPSARGGDVHWAVENLVHVVTDSQFLVSFRILVGQGSSASQYEVGCSMLGTVDKSPDAVATSFQSQPCLESVDQYYFSWSPWTTSNHAWLSITK